MKNKDLKELYEHVVHYYFADDLPKEKITNLSFCRVADFEKLDKNAIECIKIVFNDDSLDKLLEQLSLFPNLKQLCLNDCYHNENGIEPWDLLGNLRSLEKLWIRGSVELNQMALNRIASLKNLQELRFMSQWRSDGTEDFSVLKNLPRLKRLGLGIESDNCHPLWNDELGFIKEMPALEYLLLEENGHLDVSTLEVPPGLKLVSVPSYTSTRVIRKLRDAGIPAYLDRGCVWQKERNRFRKEENIK